MSSAFFPQTPSSLYIKPHMQQILQHIRFLQKSGKKVVLATGVFDLLHGEHKNFLQKAREVGDLLVVGVESDVRTRVLKGEGRPVQSQDVRLQAIQELPYVDAAFVLPEDFNTQERYEELMWQIRPAIYACSSHSSFQENKARLAQKYGGKLVVVHEYNPEVSTTILFKKNKT